MSYLSSMGHMDILVIAANNWMSTLTTDGNLPILWVSSNSPRLYPVPQLRMLISLWNNANFQRVVIVQKENPKHQGLVSDEISHVLHNLSPPCWNGEKKKTDIWIHIEFFRKRTEQMNGKAKNQQQQKEWKTLVKIKLYWNDENSNLQQLTASCTATKENW